LCDKKKALVSARIRKRMRSLKILNPKEYYDHIMSEPTGMEIVMLIDSIATNVTSFFRESKHLDFLREKTLEWLRAGQRRFRFWSAACSSGEEAYSMGFVIKDAMSASALRADVKILASDISTKVLGLAHQGLYDEAKTLSIPDGLRERYMDRIPTPKGNSYMVKHDIKEMLTIKMLNLTEMPFPLKGPLDIVFCRNVMIYFDKELRRKLVAEFYRLLKPGGFLIVGHTESLIDISGSLKKIGPSIYMK
jgi:chemotaxis protein methyltransferase CheR